MISQPGRTSVVYFITQVGATIVGFLSTWYITQTLGSATFGEYSTVVGFLFWFNIPASAIGVAVMKRASEGKEQDKFLGGGHTLNILIHVVLISFILTFNKQINIFVGLDIAIPFTILVSAQALFDLILGSLRGYKQVGTSGALKTLERILRSGIHIGALFFLSIGVSGLVFAHATAIILAAAVGLTAVNGRPMKPELRHIKSLASYARYAWLGTLKTRAFAWTDILMMRGLSISVVGLAAVSKSQIGIYKVAWTVASALALLNIAINQSLFPELSELGATDDYDQVHHYLNEGLSFVGAFLIPGLFGAVVVGDTVLTIFGSEFATGGHILVILVGSRLFAAYADQLLSTINAIDRPDVTFRVNLGYVAINISLNIIFIIAFGWYGAAVATALTALASVVFAGYALTSIIGRISVPVGELIRQLTASVIMFGVISVIQTILPRTLYWTVVLTGIGAGVYVIVLLSISRRVRRKTFDIIQI